MTNFVRRVFYEVVAPPEADEMNIDAVLSMAFDVPHIVPPHIKAEDFYQIKVNELTDAADAGTGFFPAWGRGLPAWDATPDPADGSETALEDILGAFPATWQHVVPDVAGDITFNDGTRWTVTGDVSKYLYFEAPYAATDEPSSSIREGAIYLNLDPATGHESDTYLPVANIDDLGDFLALGRFEIFPRSPETSGLVRIILRVGHA